MYTDTGINWLKHLEGKKIMIFGAGNAGLDIYTKISCLEGVTFKGVIDNNADVVRRFNEGEGFTRDAFIFQDYLINAEKEDLIIISTDYQNIKKQLVDAFIYNFVDANEIDFSIIGEGRYNQEYFDTQIEYAKVDSEIDKLFFQRFIKETDNLLEFGCGGGLLLSKLSCNSCIGVEINPAAQHYAEKLGISTVDDLDKIRNSSIDVIISTHALEHCKNPLQIVENMHKKLVDGGRCVCVVPYEPLSYSFMKNDFSQHLYIWNERTLGNLFRAGGFYIRETGVRDVAWPKYWDKLFHEESPELFNALSTMESQRTGYYSCYVICEKD